MRVFVAGATGVLGGAALPALVSAGHQVTGIARTAEKAAQLERSGASAARVDLFDARDVATAVTGHDVVCNLATHIPGPAAYFRRSPWAMNDRLHAEASRHLVDGALAAGAARYIQHSVGFMYADGAEEWLDEDAPMKVPPHGQAVLEAEAQTGRFGEGGGTAVALRFGLFYGPPAAGLFVRTARTGFVPFPGRAEAYVPLIHTDDLGAAVVAALGAPGGAYNIVDDEPITRQTLADVLAGALGRRKLRLQPRLILRVAGDRFDYLARSQRVSNARFKDATGWMPTVPSSRQGWLGTVRELTGRPPT